LENRQLISLEACLVERELKFHQREFRK